MQISPPQIFLRLYGIVKRALVYVSFAWLGTSTMTSLMTLVVVGASLVASAAALAPGVCRPRLCRHALVMTAGPAGLRRRCAELARGMGCDWREEAFEV